MDDRAQSKLLFDFLFLAITEMNRTLPYNIIFALALHSAVSKPASKQVWKVVTKLSYRFR